MNTIHPKTMLINGNGSLVDMRSEPFIQEAVNEVAVDETKTSQNETQTIQDAKKILFQKIEKTELKDLARKNKTLAELWT